MNNLYLDIHALQILPPSCVNRDDTGAPKTAIYGGVTRSRVSSQAWKKAMRDSFKDIFESRDLGYRTLHAVSLVAEEIKKLDSSLSQEAAEKKAKKVLEDAGIKTKKDTPNTEALFFLSQVQAEKLAQLAAAGTYDKKEPKKVLSENPSVDIALFGRMVAADPSLNYDAACQVAHAISTHPVETEFDYYTATDDFQTENHAGAGFLGNAEFNSSTLYRYATINLRELYRMLGNKTPDVAAGFIEAFVKSMPTGKQNSYANRTVPSDVYITLRTDQPVSMAAAFEKPVRAGNNGYVVESAKALEDYAGKVYSQFVDEPVFALNIGDDLTSLGENCSLKEAEAKIKNEIERVLASEVA